MTEKASLENQQKLEAIVETTGALIVLTDPDGKIILFNRACEELTGYKRDEVFGKTIAELFLPPEWIPIVKKRFADLDAPEVRAPHENPWITKSGEERIIEWRCTIIPSPENGRPCMLGTGIDITERKQAEETLQEKEAKYHDLYENAPDGIHSLGHDGMILEVNNTWLKMLGYERDEVIGKMKLTELLTDDGLKTFQNSFPDFKKKGFIENVEYDLKRRDGTLLPVLINATAIYDKKGNFLKSRSIVRDISVRKDYGSRLRRRSEEWEATFDSMPYGVMLLDREFNIIRANSYIAVISESPIRELISKKCYEVIHGTDKPIEGCPVLKSSNTRSTESFEYYEPRFNRYFMVYAAPILDRKGLIKAYVHSLVDITESKEKEKRVIESRDAFLNMLKDLDFSYKELRRLYEGLIYSFVNAMDAKSKWTKGHSVRVTNYALAIAKEIGLKDKDIEALRTAALLHDIGKIGTYDEILEKPDRLSIDEFNLVRMHPAKGEEILIPIGQLEISKFQNVLAIIRSHHERMNGKGYPDGLKGDEIPLLSRIISVADAFDSMTSERPYRPTPGRESAISELKRHSGTQFDPQVVDAFLRVLSKEGKHDI